VDTVTQCWVDIGRPEIYSGRANEPRELMAQIWYPAESAATATKMPWLDHVEMLGPVGWICGLEPIHEVSPFARLINRLYP
jgi:hypothetical protein